MIEFCITPLLRNQLRTNRREEIKVNLPIRNEQLQCEETREDNKETVSSTGEAASGRIIRKPTRYNLI